MEKLPFTISIGDKYTPAMEIHEQKEADDYFERLVAHYLEHTPAASRVEAEAVERENLGYFAGYFPVETRARVERLFKCAHPIFGSVEKNGPPSVETAFNIGKALGQAMRG